MSIVSEIFFRAHWDLINSALHVLSDFSIETSRTKGIQWNENTSHGNTRNSQLQVVLKDKFTKSFFLSFSRMARRRLRTHFTIVYKVATMLGTSWIKYHLLSFFVLSRKRWTSCSSSRIWSAKTSRSPRPHFRNTVESSWGGLGTHLLGPRNANQPFVLFHNPGCKERILSQVRGILVRGVYRVDRSHFVHSRVDGNHYWVHVHDSRYSNGPFTCRLWQ